MTWRLPDVDIPLGAEVEEAVMVGVGGVDGMDFDALEALQCMLERRKGGETGVKAVQLLEGDDAGRQGSGSLVKGSVELRPFAQRHADGPDRAGRPHAGPGGLRRFAAIGQESGRVLHRVQRWNARPRC